MISTARSINWRGNIYTTSSNNSRIQILFKLTQNSHQTDHILGHKTNLDTFKRIKGYKIFFNEDLLIIYELVELYFDLEKEDDVRIKKYNNAMAYFILASQAFREETLRFAGRSVPQGISHQADARS